MTASEFRAKYARPTPTDSTLTAKQYQEQAAGNKPATPRKSACKQSESQPQSESVKLGIKPLSVNAAWKGKRYRSDAYRQYQIEVKRLLPAITLPPPPYKLSLVFGYSNRAADADNGVKCFQDIIADHYGFNDKHITELNIKKELVAKGAEFITFHILTAE